MTSQLKARSCNLQSLHLIQWKVCHRLFHRSKVKDLEVPIWLINSHHNKIGHEVLSREIASKAFHWIAIQISLRFCPRIILQLPIRRFKFLRRPANSSHKFIWDQRSLILNRPDLRKLILRHRYSRVINLIRHTKYLSK